MRIVLSWLREFCPTDLAADELAERLTRQGVMVENVLRPWDGIQGVVIAKVMEVSDHPESEKLCVATVSDGSDEQVVVAGVKNFVPGDLVPWAKPGSRVPALEDPLAARRLRGIASNGMLCSARELNVADVHTGILVLNREEVHMGQDFVEAFGLNDAVLDIEVEPNRPDFLSVFGIAREVSVLTGAELIEPDLSLKESGEEANVAATVTIDAPDACPRYIARVIRGVTEGETPISAQARLTACGMRPISAVVDATNYVMLELGQPLHGFDLDLIAGPAIVVRRAWGGEKILTLDDQERSLSTEDLLICDQEKPVAIAGVMGGATSEVSSGTASVLLESAYFTRTGILRTARRLDIHSEASHRFERGTDPENLDRAAARCAGLITEWAGGEVLCGVAEAGSVPGRRWVSVRPSRASALLGLGVTSEEVHETFDRLRMVWRGSDDNVEVEVPGYRTDIEREVDLIEEVIRLKGYDLLGSSMPSSKQGGGTPEDYAFRERVRDSLVRAGLREAKLLSFASERDIEMFGGGNAVRLANPLQADENSLRTSLIPGLLRAVVHNRDLGTQTVNLFEVGSTFRLADPVDEVAQVAFVLAGPSADGWPAERRELDASDAKGVLESMLADLGVGEPELTTSGDAWMHPARSADVGVGGRPAGVIGEIHPRVARGLGIDGRVAICSLSIEALMLAVPRGFELRPVPRFPPVRRDLAFELPEDVAAAEVAKAIEDAGGGLLYSCVLFDVFSGPPLPVGKRSLAYSIELRSEERTLAGVEVEPALEAIAREIDRRFGGKLRKG